MAGTSSAQTATEPEQDVDIVFNDEVVGKTHHQFMSSGWSAKSGHSEMVEIDVNKQSGLTPNVNSPNVNSPNIAPNELYTTTDLATTTTKGTDTTANTVDALASTANTSAFHKFMSLPNKLEYIALALSIFALLFSIILLSSVKGSVNSQMNEYEETYNAALNVKLHYDAVDAMDEAQTIYVGNYYGWSYAQWRGAAYRKNDADYQGGNDVQYPFADIHVRYGDTLIFKRADESMTDNLFLVPAEVYESCNFSAFADAEGVMDSSSVLWLADADDMYNANGTAQYEFPIEDWSRYTFDNDLFAQLIQADILYFTSALRWNSRWGQSCRGGLKVRVLIDRSNRTTMPIRRSSDKWRGIQKLDTVMELSASIGHISRSLMLKQFTDEQRVRSVGDSGLTNVRGHYDGDNEWDDATFTNQGSGSMHDHAQSLRVLGLGEIQAVLNGVEFETHHNDYNLEMPSLTSNEYGATQPIPFPDVPPEVLNAGSVDAQIEEMQEWFRAFKNQDKSHRNYTDYFKPVLCVLEGNWITDNDELSQPFESDLSELDASTWSDLQDKMRYFANSGRKTVDEVLGHLPSSIRNTDNNSFPIVSNWEYRFVCHPLKSDVPTARFKVVDDLAVQLYGSVLTRKELKHSRRARFALNTFINLDDIDGDTQWTNGRKKWNYRDYIMEAVVGRDGYGVNLTDELPDGTGQALHYVDDKVMNAGYYSRFYSLGGADAMGSTGHRRSWCDRNLFVAKTTQSKVSPISMAFEAVDENTSQVLYYPTISKWSYAIPMEIVYLTPLTKWNPYNINEKSDDSFNYDKTGDCSGGKDTAFDGWSSNNAYFTPSKFYESGSSNVCATGSNGNVYSVTASGHYVVFPEIGGGVGLVRQRWPIFPIHERGSSEYKELKALQEVMLPDDYDSVNRSDVVNGVDFWNGDTRDLLYGIELSLEGGDHEHNVYIPGWKVKQVWFDEDAQQWLMSSDEFVEVESEESDGHLHTLRVWMQSREENVYRIKQCRYGAVYDGGVGWSDGQCDDYHDQVNRVGSE